MSYSERDGQVILTMSKEDYSKLILCIGFARSYMAVDQNRFNTDELMNRLNSGNPNYTPYQVGEKK